MKRFASLALAAAIAAAPAAASAQVWGTAATMTGTRTTPAASGLVSGGNWQDFSIAWNITQEGNLLRYTYTFTGFSAPGISHAILTLSDGCGASCANTPVWTLGETSVAGEIGAIDTYDGSEPSNPGLPGTIYGVKFNRPEGVDGGTGLVLTFLSDRMPVWGDFYAKGGSSSFVYNNGLLAANHNSNDVTFFVARPDTQPVSTVPEPSTYALLGSGLLAIAGMTRRRRTA